MASGMKITEGKRANRDSKKLVKRQRTTKRRAEKRREELALLKPSR